MREEWTGRVIGELHLHGIRQRELAAAAGITNAYCGMILNGKRNPKNGKERLEQALASLLEKR
jgi:transcriptional regulator with XRE-family HTH domain